MVYWARIECRNGGRRLVVHECDRCIERDCERRNWPLTRQVFVCRARVFAARNILLQLNLMRLPFAGEKRPFNVAWRVQTNCLQTFLPLAYAQEAELGEAARNWYRELTQHIQSRRAYTHTAGVFVRHSSDAFLWKLLKWKTIKRETSIHNNRHMTRARMARRNFPAEYKGRNNGWVHAGAAATQWPRVNTPRHFHLPLLHRSYELIKLFVIVY